MCFYKPNKPPCTCAFLQLVQPCPNARVYPSSSNNPIIHVCRVRLIARGVGQRFCHRCSVAAGQRTKMMTTMMNNNNNGYTMPILPKQQQQDLHRLSPASTSPFPPRSSSSSSPRLPESMARSVPVSVATAPAPAPTPAPIPTSPPVLANFRTADSRSSSSSLRNESTGSQTLIPSEAARFLVDMQGGEGHGLDPIEGDNDNDRGFKIEEWIS